MADVEKEPEKTIAEDLVVTKYKLAGEIVNSEYSEPVNGTGKSDSDSRRRCYVALTQLTKCRFPFYATRC